MAIQRAKVLTYKVSGFEDPHGRRGRGWRARGDEGTRGGAPADLIAGSHAHR